MTMKKLFACLGVFAVFAACTNSAGSPGKDGAGAAAGAGGGGVSGSGSDLYYLYTITGGSEKMAMNGTMKLFLAASGKVRMEMLMGIDTNGAAVKDRSPIIVLGNSDNPTLTYYVDDVKKTYSKNHIDTTSDNGSGMKTESTVTRVGDESILGFHAVHARILSTHSIGSLYKAMDTIDLWKSNDIPMQPAFRKWMERYEAKANSALYSPEVSKQLTQMGCEGLFVKMVMHGKESKTFMVLTKVEKKDLPGSLFEIPAGYTEDKSAEN